LIVAELSIVSRAICIPHVFVGPPRVAILDEPTTGVDPNARQQMQEIFLNAVKAKLTIILTSHSMDEW
jgi:ABC-type multidrug transport system ATPase subunit